MKVYKKNRRYAYQQSGYKLHIDTTDTTIAVKYYIRARAVDDWIETPIFSKIYSLDEFKTDHVTLQGPQSAHILYVFFDRYRQPSIKYHQPSTPLQVVGNPPAIIDVIRYNKDSKAGVGDLTQLYAGFPLFVVAIPFADSPIDDWTIISEADETYINGELLNVVTLIEYKRSLTEIADKHLPAIVLSKNENEITAMLFPSKQGVELYFETTTGSLDATRAITDENGCAKVKVSNTVPGKVKVGFKYFSGKNEIAV